MIKLPYEELDAGATFNIYWLLKHLKYIFKIVPSKNTFSETAPSKNINFNFISLIYSSSEPSEELSKSSIICLTTFFSIYLHSFKKTC